MEKNIINFKKYKSLINNLFLKYLNKLNFLTSIKSIKKVSNFNKVLISLITLMFCYFFYLTIPNLYDKLWVQTEIENQLKSEFDINFNLSSDITYVILPSPHFIVKDVVILDDKIEKNKKIADVKILKIFISQKNLFLRENLSVKKIELEESNLLFNKNNFKFLSILINKKLSEKKIKIKKSNFFFKNKTNEDILSITKLSKVKIFYDKEKSLNLVNLDGEIFNIPFVANIQNDFKNLKMISQIKSKKIKLNYENIQDNKNEVKTGTSEISLINAKLIHKYEIQKNSFIFKSNNSNLLNNNISYDGEMSFKPFYLSLNLDLDKVNLLKVFNQDSVLIELLKSEIFYNDNLNLLVSLKAPKITKTKIFKNLILNFKIEQGMIDFNDTNVELSKIGSANLSNTNLFFNEGELELNGELTLKIDDKDKFYKFLQTKKNSRKMINNIKINFNYNIQKDVFEFNNILIDDKKSSIEIENFISNYNLEKKSFKNLIEIKNFANKVFNNYDG